MGEIVGKGNVEWYVSLHLPRCSMLKLRSTSLCLTCEKNHHGGFTPKPENPRRTSRHLSRDFTADPPCVRGRSSVSHSRESMSTGLNSLKHETAIKQEPFSDDEHEVYIGLSTATSLTTEEECDTPIENVSNTPRIASPFGESLASDVDSVIMPPRRERYARKAAQNSKSWLLLKGRGSKTDVDENLAFVGDDEEFPPDFPRCATCAKPLSDQIWYNGRYFDHCQRYIFINALFLDNRRGDRPLTVNQMCTPRSCVRASVASPQASGSAGVSSGLPYPSRLHSSKNFHRSSAIAQQE